MKILPFRFNNINMWINECVILKTENKFSPLKWWLIIFFFFTEIPRPADRWLWSPSSDRRTPYLNNSNEIRACVEIKINAGKKIGFVFHVFALCALPWFFPVSLRFRARGYYGRFWRTPLRSFKKNRFVFVVLQVRQTNISVIYSNMSIQYVWTSNLMW